MRDDSGRLSVTAGGASGEARFHLEVVICNPRQRSDSVARSVTARLDRQQGDAAPALATIGLISGGLADVERVTSTFSVVRSAGTGSAVRGGGATVVWIDVDSLLASFSTDADDVTVRSTLGQHIDLAVAELATRLAA